MDLRDCTSEPRPHWPIVPGFSVSGLMLLFLTSAGCQGISSAPFTSPDIPPGSTYVLHLPGMAGDATLDRKWMKALEEGGVAQHIALYDWTCHDAGLDALEAHDRNHDEASKVAAILSKRAANNPAGKIFLTAESAGAGVAIWALERLPTDVQVDDVLLVAAAVSPGYDLSAALRHVRGKMYYFSSVGDWYTLGMCTSIFGTMDGQKSQAAGYVGFHRPLAADPTQYAKLVEIKYDPAWAQWGDFGGHTGGMAVPFAREVIVPLLLHAEQTGNELRAATME